MSLLVKLDPFDSWRERDTISFSVPGYRDPVVRVGDEVFFWTSETAGGVGFSGIGIILETEVESDGNFALECRVSCLGSTPRVSKSDLKPHRDAARDLPISRLSEVLYKPSLNKVVAIDEGAARFLRERSARR